MKVDLDRRENLDGFQKYVSTLRTISISISICLDVETTRLKKIIFGNSIKNIKINCNRILKNLTTDM